MKNLRFEDATVQFGEMGQGIQPSYQVFFPNGNLNTYRGANHKPFMPLGAFNREHISQSFSSADLHRAFGRRPRHPIGEPNAAIPHNETEKR